MLLVKWSDRYDWVALGLFIAITAVTGLATKDWTFAICLGGVGNAAAYLLRRRADLPDHSLFGRLRAHPGKRVPSPPRRRVPPKERWAIIGLAALLWVGTLLVGPSGLFSVVAFGLIGGGFLVAIQLRSRDERPTAGSAPQDL